MSRSIPVQFEEHLLRERYRLVSGLEVTGGGTGIVSHAGSRCCGAGGQDGPDGRPVGGAAVGRLLVHDRGRVLADLACAIADGARVISDFRVMGDQGELFGQVASVPTAWRTLKEIAAGGRAHGGAGSPRR